MLVEKKNNQCVVAECKNCGNVDMMAALPVSDQTKKELELMQGKGYKIKGMEENKAKNLLGCKCPAVIKAVRDLKEIKRTLSKEDPEFVAAMFIPAVIKSLDEVIKRLEKENKD